MTRARRPAARWSPEDGAGDRGSGPRFGFRGEGVFLNHASVSPPCRAARRAVHEAVEAIAREQDDAVRSRDTVDRARDAFAGLVGSRRASVQCFQNTSAALSAVAWGLRWKPGDEVLVSPNEFVSNVLAWQMQAPRGVRVRPLATQRERVDPDALRRQLAKAPRTRVVAVSAVHWATGARQDLRALAEAAHDALATNTYKWLLSVNGTAFADLSPALVEQLDPASVGWLSVAGEPEPERLDAGGPEYRLGTGVERLLGGAPSALGNLAAVAAFRELRDVGLGAIEARTRRVARRVMEEADARGIGVATPRDGPASAPSHAGLVALEVADAPKVAARLKAEGIRLGARGGWLRVSPHFYTQAREVDALFEALRKLGVGRSG